jgi:F-type H+-transporting ATPase subunit delta
MSASAVARRYAKALLQLADESKQTEKVARDLSDLRATWDGSAELRNLFENPGFSTEVRKKVLEALAKRMGLAPLLMNTLLLLSDRRRLRYLPEIAEAFTDLAEAKSGRVRVTVTTASALPDKYFAELQKVLESATGRKVVVEKHEDPSIIAGVVTRIGDKVFDGSVRNRLVELKDTLLSS